ncbi:MAG TPA: hypothetical protein VMV29_10725, partial [Ktedonobacterales bacterium]|nr:hypothetical protein [Ktedonobacterales bacterium]
MRRESPHHRKRSRAARPPLATPTPQRTSPVARASDTRPASGGLSGQPALSGSAQLSGHAHKQRVVGATPTTSALSRRAAIGVAPAAADERTATTTSRAARATS